MSRAVRAVIGVVLAAAVLAGCAGPFGSARTQPVSITLGGGLHDGGWALLTVTPEAGGAPAFSRNYTLAPPGPMTPSVGSGESDKVSLRVGVYVATVLVSSGVSESASWSMPGCGLTALVVYVGDTSNETHLKWSNPAIC